jgi:hypothetical protein
VKQFILTAVAAATLAVSLQGSAAEISVKAVVVPKEQMRLDFADGSKHFLLMVRREGKAAGTGTLAGELVQK